jgi:hypothetical protein
MYWCSYPVSNKIHIVGEQPTNFDPPFTFRFCNAQLWGGQVSAGPQSNEYTMWIDFYSDARYTTIGFRCTVSGQGTVCKW